MSNSSVDQVLSKLVEAKLIRIVSGTSEAEDQLELAHESLLYGWPHFQVFLEKEQLNRYKRLRLTKDVEDWVTQGHPSDLLWAGSMLKEAECYSRLSTSEVSFLSASKDATLAARVAKENAAKQIEELSGRLRQVEDENLSLKAQVRSLHSSAKETLLYQNKYMNLRALAILSFASMIAAVFLTIAIYRTGSGNNVQWTEEPVLEAN